MDTRKFIASVVVTVAVLVAVLFAFFTLTRPAIESVPFDWGWIGLVFIFGNGFFLSYCLLNKKVGMLDRLLLTVGLGFGVTFVVMILLGVLWQITLTTVLLTHVILLAVLGVIALRGGLKLPRFTLEQKNIELTKQTLLQAFLIAFIGVLAFTATYNTLSVPPTEWDSLAYGVNYAKIIFQNSHIPVIAGSSIGIEMSAPYPPGTQLSATFLYVFAGSVNDFYYRLLSPIFSLATLLVVYKFAWQITKNRTSSVFAASALALTPFFWELFTQETYLMVLTFMLTMSAYFFHKVYSANSAYQRKHEIIGSLFCGFTALTSYIGLLAFGVLLVYSVHKRVGLKRFGVLIGVAIFVALPWYLRNLVLLGNPVYPFAGIGKYLDPILHGSTTMHFQAYQLLSLYAWTSMVCKVCVVLLVIGVVFFTLSKKRKDFFSTLVLYLLLVSFSLMAFYVAFPRYLIIALPTSAVFFGFAFNTVPNRRRWPQITTTIFIVLVVLVSAVMLPYMDTVKPPAAAGQNRAQYIANLFEEGGAWAWINENTLPDTKIATYDIKEYYLNRTLFSLDGNAAAPLYYMDNIQEAIEFLNDTGIGYFLSVPWASPNKILNPDGTLVNFDQTLPPAYNSCILTKYLGDLDYLPPVYVDDTGTAVYHVGGLGESLVNEVFASLVPALNLVAPLKQRTVNVNISGIPYQGYGVGACNISFPVDYRTSNITVHVKSTTQKNTTHLDLELWNKIIPQDQLQKLKPDEEFAPDKNFMIAKSPLTYDCDNTESTLSWYIDKAGYFTIRVFDKYFTESFDVTLDIWFN